jgi:Polyketide cyclase / dehydrase and lipid transport
MSYSDSIDIECSPEVAFSVVTDLPEMERLSPENTGGQWIGGATGPAVGAKFKGSNTRAGDSWSTTVKVVTYDPPRRFAFNVTYKVFNIARWEYSIEPAPGGCRVTETWTDRRNALVRKQGDADGFVRAEFTKDSIRTTLERLKSLCEQPGQ